MKRLEFLGKSISQSAMKKIKGGNEPSHCYTACVLWYINDCMEEGQSQHWCYENGTAYCSNHCDE